VMKVSATRSAACVSSGFNRASTSVLAVISQSARYQLWISMNRLKLDSVTSKTLTHVFSF
jgi:hypothetical protein